MASYKGDVIRSGFQTSENQLRLQGLLVLFEIATEKTVGTKWASTFPTLMKIQLGSDSLRSHEGRKVDEKT